jgi:hypothetical protein
MKENKNPPEWYIFTYDEIENFWIDVNSEKIKKQEEQVKNIVKEENNDLETIIKETNEWNIYHITLFELIKRKIFNIFNYLKLLFKENKILWSLIIIFFFFIIISYILLIILNKTLFT